LTPAEHWAALAAALTLGVVADFDGTLVPFAPRPEDVHPGPELLGALRELIALPGVYVAIVSGRPRAKLEHLFADVPGLLLAAEHGGWLRDPGAWRASVSGEASSLSHVAAALETLARTYPGAWVERKTWSVCLHFREVGRRDRTALLVEANATVEAWLGEHPGYERLEVVQGLEVRLAAVRKSAAVAWVRDQAGPGIRLLAIGDDVTDEDMFGALGPADESVWVGSEPQHATAARWTLTEPGEAVDLLRWVVAVRTGKAPPAPAVLPRATGLVPERLAGTRSAYRLLVLSNRLPDLRAPLTPGDPRHRNVGGLVSALEGVLAARHALWLGWSGRTTSGPPPSPMLDTDGPGAALAWIDFPAEWRDRYYNGFCNRGLWPVFHTFPGRLRFRDDEWACYVQANRTFAAAARELVDPDVPVWVHDYHLLLVATELRRLGHRGPIGLFLHIPFPAVDLFSMIPWANELLAGMLEFDLLGFQTARHVDNFRQCVTALSKARIEGETIVAGEHRVRMGAFPIGIVPEGFQEPPEPETAEEVAALLTSIAPSRLVIGVDRLDYTKGIPERLFAFGRLFELFPEWRGKVSLVQISVPSRGDVPEYAEQRQLVESAVGRINGEFGEAHWTPIRYVYRSYGRNQLAQLFRAADVGYVTPLRDGMNLVAKEYVAAQDPANPGALLLSRFAGAAVELDAAILTNPYHRDGMARDLDRALRMPLEERLERHGKLSAAVARSTAVTWAEEFLAALEAAR
jgi:trehalose 6-phosphate synthase